MNMSGLAVGCLTLLMATPAVAFEGILDVRVTAGGKTGMGELYLREAGDLRADVPITDPVSGTTWRNTVLVRAPREGQSRPLGMAHVLHNTRQWERHTLRDAKLDKERYLVELLGVEKVLERPTEHVRVIDSQSGDVLEMWLAQGVSDMKLIDRVFLQAVRYASSLALALDDDKKWAAKGKGWFPLKMHFKKKSNGAEALFEVVRMTEKKLEPSLWAIPKGYSQGALPMSPFSTSDERKKKHDPLGDAANKLQGLFGR